MFSLSTISGGLTKVLGRSGLALRHYRPEIFTGAGIIGVGVCVVTACVATLKIEAVLDESRLKIAEIRDGREQHPDKYSEQDCKHDMLVVQTRTAVSVVKLYAIPASIGLGSIILLIGSHRILRKENAALTAAYMGISEAFKKYRERVIAEQGRDKDQEYRFGSVKEELILTDGEGKTEVKEITRVNPGEMSLYARVFDETNPNFNRNPEMNLRFLKAQQKYANDRLHARGYLFLNEVYEALSFPMTEAGQIVGWVDGNGDNCVDFHLYDIDSQQARDFINGYTKNVLLDFNVDGIVYDIFSKKNHDRQMAKAD